MYLVNIQDAISTTVIESSIVASMATCPTWFKPRKPHYKD